MNTLPFQINGFAIELPKPTWWDELIAKYNIDLDRIRTLNTFYDIQGEIGDYSSIGYDMKKAKLFTNYYLFLESTEIPYKVVWAAESQGEYEWVVRIYEGLLASVSTNPVEGIPDASFYGTIGDAYFELNKIEEAKKYYKLSSEFIANKLYSKRYGEKYQKLMAITDVDAFISEKNQFRNEMNRIQNHLKEGNNKEKAISNLYGTIEYMDMKKLDILQLAFVQLLDNDATSGHSKIWTAESRTAFQQKVNQFNGREVPNLDMIPIGAEFPTESCDKWTLQIPGWGDEVIHLEYERYDLIKVALSH